MAERERIGKRIAELRKAKGLTQKDLAERSGVGYGHIARIELGRYSVGIDTLHKICEALDAKIEITKAVE